VKRILNFVDSNIYSETYGYADRDFWSWRTKDFNNGSFQSLVYALSCIKNDPIFSEIYKKHNINEQIDNGIDAYKEGCFKELENYGSSQESFPNENSFCVTSTLLYDLISALNVSKEIKSLSDNQKNILEKTAIFISNNIESHANIGNHLLGSLAALSLYLEKVDSQNVVLQKGAIKIADKISFLWNEEGWIEEYDGADIGYLSLSLHFLMDVDSKYLKDKEKWIKLIIQFISHFFHKDGSIGNYYGSRGSSIIYPSGLIKAGFKEITEFLISSIKDNKIPTQSDLDDTNFAPYINSLIRSATLLENSSLNRINLPLNESKYIKIFHDAGFIIIINKQNQTIIDLNKSGLITEIKNSGSKREAIPTIVHKKSSKVFCTINSNYVLEENSKITANIESRFYQINTKPLSRLNLIGSRLLIPFFIFFPWTLKRIKLAAVSKYFSPSKPIGSHLRKLIIQNYKLEFIDEYEIPDEYILVNDFYHHPVRMASQNYF
tara:strand:+ start:8396 stop:9871 length:1476 start_codon:yes stop_codon:yes gene_type:complete